MKEEWRPVVGWEGLYEVSDLGRVRSLGRVITQPNRWGTLTTYKKKGCVLRPGRTRAYRQVQLQGGDRYEMRALHLVVAYAFLGPRPPGAQARHLRGATAGDALDNLAWGTIDENTADRILHGTVRKGENHSASKLTTADVLAIRAAKGRQTDVAARYGIQQQHVSQIKLRKRWAHV